MDMDETLYQKIVELGRRGDGAFRDAAYDEAFRFYSEAFNLLPAPTFRWQAATWLAAALGNTMFRLKEWARAARFYGLALKSPGGDENPFFHLRIGQARFEMGDSKAADEALLRAYRLDGRGVFAAEDPKYLKHVLSLAAPPEISPT